MRILAINRPDDHIKRCAHQVEHCEHSVKQMNGIFREGHTYYASWFREIIPLDSFVSELG
jgi:hypothetical protein